MGVDQDAAGSGGGLESHRDLRALPKAHLHLHLVGSMRPSTLEDLRPGTATALPDRFEGFSEFVDAYLLAESAIRSADDLARVVVDVLEDARADGAVWVEPTLYLDSFPHVIGPGELVLEVVTDALRRARTEVGIGATLIVAAQRHLGPEDAMRQAKLAARAGPDVVGAFGLVGDELAHPMDTFADAMRIASESGLALTPHAGEFGGPDEVARALELGVDRVQHGVAAVHDPALMAQLVDMDVCLDVCPTSNIALGVVASIEDHPLPRLLREGVAVSLGADDSLLFSSSLLGEYELARTNLGLTDREVAAIAEASITHSNASRQVKVAAREEIRGWLGAADGGRSIADHDAPTRAPAIDDRK